MDRTALLSVQRWMELYNEQPFEVVDGEIETMHPSGRYHARLSRELLTALQAYLDEHPLGEVWPDNTPYLLDGDERDDWVRDSRVPDVSFITRQKMAAHDEKFGDREGPWRLAPDLAVEIVSPNDSYSKIDRKIEDYLRYGTRLVWVIDPQTRKIKVHSPDDPEGTTLREDDVLRGEPVLPGWSMAVGEVLAKAGRKRWSESGE
jgi:Uma2 family endonuclease